MACLEAAPWPSCFPIAFSGPPSQGGPDCNLPWFVIAADSQEDDYYVHEGQ